MKRKLYVLTFESATYDQNSAMAILARNEIEARNLANQESSFEGRVWSDHEKVKCKEIDANKSQVVLIDYWEG